MPYAIPNHAGCIDKKMQQETQDLTEVAVRISKNAAFLKGFLDVRGLPQPSFTTDTASEFPNPKNEPTIQIARELILEDTKTLFDLVLGPVERLKWTIWPVFRPMYTSLWQDPFALTLSA